MRTCRECGWDKDARCSGRPLVLLLISPRLLVSCAQGIDLLALDSQGLRAQPGKHRSGASARARSLTQMKCQVVRDIAALKCVVY